MKNDIKEIIEFKSFTGISVTYENIPTSFPAHWHNAAEFTAVFKDHCRFRIGDQFYEAMKGDIVLVWPRELHEVISIPENSTIFTQFTPSFLETNLDLVSMYRVMARYHIVRAEKEPELAHTIFDKMLSLKSLLHEQDYFSETKSKMTIYQILLMIAEYLMKERREEIGTGRAGDHAWTYMRTACNYVAEHSAEDITENDVAEIVGLTPYYFSKIFKKHMKTSFPAYLSSVRVRTAIRLLAEENLSITDCAYQAGFQSITTFNRVFREITDHTPRDYRKLYNTNAHP